MQILRTDGWRCSGPAGPIYLFAAKRGKLLLVRITRGFAVLSKQDRSELRSWSRTFRADRAETWFFRKRAVEKEVVYQRRQSDDNELALTYTYVNATANMLAGVLKIGDDAPRTMLLLKYVIHCLHDTTQRKAASPLAVYNFLEKMSTEEGRKVVLAHLTSDEAKACWNAMAKLRPKVFACLKDRMEPLISAPAPVKYAPRGLFDLRLRNGFHCRFCYHHEAEQEYVAALRFMTAPDAVRAADILGIDEWQVTDLAGEVVQEKLEASSNHPDLEPAWRWVPVAA